MPLTSKGEEIMSAMKSEYGGDKAKEVFYASKNKGTISGVDSEHGTIGKMAEARSYKAPSGGAAEPRPHPLERMRAAAAAKRADELSPLSDRVDALNSRADTIADRDFEARRKDAIREVQKVEAGKVNPSEAGRFSRPRERGDAERRADGPPLYVTEKDIIAAERAHEAAKQSGDKERIKGAREHLAELKSGKRRDDEMGRPDAQKPYISKIGNTWELLDFNGKTVAKGSSMQELQPGLKKELEKYAKAQERRSDEDPRLRDFDQAYQVGRKAGWRGVPRSSNPHSEQIKKEGWGKGWTDGYWERQNAEGPL